MKSEKSSRFTLFCPYTDCSVRSHTLGQGTLGPKFKPIVRTGSYFRGSDRKKVHRFFCQRCRRGFSSATLDPCFRQKKRQINQQVLELLVSCVSQRRIARLLKLNRKTVVRKLLNLSAEAKRQHTNWLGEIEASSAKVSMLHFDELETFERSKCLPLSVPLAVEVNTRKILGYRVCSMPAKGPLAEFSRKKYGFRRDDRSKAANSLFKEISPIIASGATVTSDQNPKYPSWIRRVFRTLEVKHMTVKGRRGCIAGQGELKKIGFDPLFDLNHSCAMFRANVNRLVRRTWCTTKRMDRLDAHLALYVQYHNQTLTKPRLA